MKKFCGELSVTKLCSWYRTEVLFLALTVVVTTSEDCVKISPCKCQFRNGSVINLESLAARGKARFQNIESLNVNDTDKYFYNPCFDFKLPDPPEVPPTRSSCDNGVAACEVTLLPNPLYASLGNQQSADFGYDPIFKTVFLIYRSATTSKSAKITLICNADPHQEDALVVKGKRVESNIEIVEMNLISRCACPGACGHKGLSAGSVLIILFCVFVILYLLFGMVYNKLTRGAQGWELIPNYEFWQDFPLLVRDGCVYVASGCKPDTTYERI